MTLVEEFGKDGKNWTHSGFNIAYIEDKNQYGVWQMGSKDWFHKEPVITYDPDTDINVLIQYCEENSRYEK